MMDASGWPITIVESPFAGDVERNRGYALRCCADCLARGEVPYASHVFFTQFLQDLQPQERELGLTAGYAFWRGANKVAFYVDLGMSGGMERAKKRAVAIGMPWEERSLGARAG